MRNQRHGQAHRSEQSQQQSIVEAMHLNATTPHLTILEALILFTVIGAAILIAMFIVPDWLAEVSFTWSGEKPRIYWYLGRSSAFVAFLWLWLAMLMGLLMSNRLARIWPGGPTAFGIHQFASLVGLAFAIFHAFILMGSRFLHYDLMDVLIPFHSDAYRPLSVALGQISFYGMLVVILSFYLQRRLISPQVWRVIHFLSFTTFAGTALHGIQTGSDTEMAWVQGLYAICVLSVGLLTLYRLGRWLVPLALKAATAIQQITTQKHNATMRFERTVPAGKPITKAPAPPPVSTVALRKSTPPAPAKASVQMATAKPEGEVLIVYGSQSGKTEVLARQAMRFLADEGVVAKLLDGAAVTLEQLQKTSRLILLTSTYGSGEPPDNIARLYGQLKAAPAGCLNQLEYCVLALGDRQYPNFCKAGKDFDARLLALGARSLLSVVVCESEDRDLVDVWMNDMASALSHQKTTSVPAVATPQLQAPIVTPKPSRKPVSAPATASAPVSVATMALPVAMQQPLPALPLSIEDTRPFFMPLPASTLTRATRNHATKRYFDAPVLRNANLCGAGNVDGDDRSIRQIVFSLLGSGLTYEPGDAIGVLPVNARERIDELLRVMKMSPDAVVPLPDGSEAALSAALTYHYDITRLTEAHLKLVVHRTGDAALKRLLQPERESSLSDLIYGRQLIDLLSLYPQLFHSPLDFVAALGKLQPRLYSISSSRKLYPDQAHLTVGVLRYSSYGRMREGVCSADLAQVSLRESRPIFIHTQRHFRLPADPTTPIIMIGAGTGIAPFRAFLQERMVTGATGKNWLFFGCRNAGSDFLYQDEVHQFQVRGLLNRFNVAFSRDQAEKVYVQHLIQQKAAKLWHWLQQGAHVYVCGDAKHMAKSVEHALLEVATQIGGHSDEAANAWLDELQQAGRYQRDVYGD